MRRRLGKVSAKGAIVIDNAIRKELGIEPGWETLQEVKEGKVVIEFLPPVQRGSLFGALRSIGDTSWLETDEALEETIEQACQQVAAEANP